MPEVYRRIDGGTLLTLIARTPDVSGTFEAADGTPIAIDMKPAERPGNTAVAVEHDSFVGDERVRATVGEGQEPTYTGARRRVFDIRRTTGIGSLLISGSEVVMVRLQTGAPLPREYRVKE